MRPGRPPQAARSPAASVAWSGRRGSAQPRGVTGTRTAGRDEVLRDGRRLASRGSRRPGKRAEADPGPAQLRAQGVAAPAATRGGARRARASLRGVEGRARSCLAGAGSERPAGGSREGRWDLGKEFRSFSVQLSEVQVGGGTPPPRGLGLGPPLIKCWGRGERKFEAWVTPLQAPIPNSSESANCPQVGSLLCIDIWDPSGGTDLGLFPRGSTDTTHLWACFLLTKMRKLSACSPGLGILL